VLNNVQPNKHKESTIISVQHGKKCKSIIKHSNNVPNAEW
jgi:hypothetical protein